MKLNASAGNNEKAKNFKGTIKRLFSCMKPYRFGLFIVIIFTIVSSFIALLGPRVLGLATNEIFEGSKRILENTGSVDFAKMGKIIVILIIIYVTSSTISYLQQFIMAGVAQKTMRDIRGKIDEKIQTLPLNYYDTNSFGDILSRVTNDVDAVAINLEQGITQSVSAIITVITIFVMMLTISPTLTIIGLVTLPLTMFSTIFIVKKSQTYFIGQQSTLGEINGHIEEMYNTHNIVKVFGKEKDVIETFDNINHKLYGHAMKAQFISSMIMPCVMFFGNIGYILVAAIGGIFAVNGKLSIGDIQAFIQYLRLFMQPIQQTANIANTLQSTVAAAERFFEFLDEPNEVPETTTPKTLGNIAGNVTFEHVKFGYNPANPLIKDLSIRIHSGDKIAIVGPTGAGKTTLVNLLMRFYDINAGKITIDDTDIMDLTRQDLRSLFGMVLQDTWLFKGSILENIRYGNLQASDEDVYAAAKAAYADRFIRTLPDGYQMQLNEEASNISQGQRQLLTIARAILSNPKILILDEATSSVDTRTEVLIQKAMKVLMKDRTSFVIAHRLSTIKDADLILVLQEGDIVETGTHNQLLEQGGFYANLYNSQFAENNKAD